MFKITFLRVIRNPIYCGRISIQPNSNEEQMIKGLHEPLILSNNTIGLFKDILEEQNIKTQKASYLYSQKINREKGKRGVSRGRKLFIAGVLKIDDYNEFKKENQVNI